MKKYRIIEKTAEANWNNAEILSVSEQPWFVTPDVCMNVQLMWDFSRLYIHQTAFEKNIRAEYTTHLSHVCEDSCMEFFIAPGKVDPRYFNFELNPNGALMLGFGLGRNDRVKLLPNNPTQLFNIRTVNSSSGNWEVYYEIPASFISTFFPGFVFERGMNIKANFYKCGDKTDHVHYLTWNTMTSEKPDYHRYCDFGFITLA